VHGGLYALRIVARKYEFRDPDERQPLMELIDSCFPVSGWEGQPEEDFVRGI
jgi:importin-7